MICRFAEIFIVTLAGVASYDGRHAVINIMTDAANDSRDVAATSKQQAQLSQWDRATRYVS